MNYQPGHPHGFCSTIWMGEAATCQPLLDPFGRIAALKRETWPYPEALKAALITRFGWEVDFAIDNAQLHLIEFGCIQRGPVPAPARERWVICRAWGVSG
jgi:hypothetical protein